jgi:hypothetical protein
MCTLLEKLAGGVGRVWSHTLPRSAFYVNVLVSTLPQNNSAYPASACPQGLA